MVSEKFNYFATSHNRLKLANSCRETHVEKLKLACVKDTTTVGKNVESWQLTFANRSHVKYEFTNMKFKLVKKVGENRDKFCLSPTVFQHVCQLFVV